MNIRDEFQRRQLRKNTMTMKIPENIDPEMARTLIEKAPGMSVLAPFSKLLGMEMLEYSPGIVRLKLPYRDDLAGDPDSGIIHGGVITALLDNAAGAAVATRFTRLQAVATLDLRIDYMRPADKGRDVIGEVECYHLTRTIAFVRGWAYHDTRDKVIATAAGSFALSDLDRMFSHNAPTPAIEAPSATQDEN